jgi:hypothetical protein
MRNWKKADREMEFVFIGVIFCFACFLSLRGAQFRRSEVQRNAGECRHHCGQKYFHLETSDLTGASLDNAGSDLPSEAGRDY